MLTPCPLPDARPSPQSVNNAKSVRCLRTFEGRGFTVQKEMWMENQRSCVCVICGICGSISSICASPWKARNSSSRRMNESTLMAIAECSIDINDRAKVSYGSVWIGSCPESIEHLVPIMQLSLWSFCGVVMAMQNASSGHSDTELCSTTATSLALIVLGLLSRDTPGIYR